MTSRARLLIAAASLLATACQLTPNFATGYEVPAWESPDLPAGGSLAVERFAEERPPRYFASSHRMWLTYVPLLPYVSMPYERVDENVRVTSDAIARGGPGATHAVKVDVAPPFEQYTYPASFAEAIASDLRASSLFEQVDYVGSEGSAGYDYVLSGTLRESPLQRAVTSYGLGMAGVLLWILPIPMSKTSAEVALDLSLADAKTGEVVWSGTLASDVKRLITLYTSSAMVYGRGGAFSFNLEPAPSGAGVDRRSLFGWHFAALRRAMLGARGEIGAAVLARKRVPAP